MESENRIERTVGLVMLAVLAVAFGLLGLFLGPTLPNASVGAQPSTWGSGEPLETD